MRLRNVWFEIGSFYLTLFLVGCAFAAFVNGRRMGQNFFDPTVIGTAAIFIALAVYSFRHSIQRGKILQKNREAKRQKN